MLVIAGVTGILAMIIFGRFRNWQEHLPIWEREYSGVYPAGAGVGRSLVP